MEIKIINESGLEAALIGMKFSFQPECSIDDIVLLEERYDISDYERHFDRCMETAMKLRKKDLGHNKFIEHIQVWMIIRAPLYWWKQFDTYRVGTSKLSKSTMHTLMKRRLTQDDFEGGLHDYDTGMLDVLNFFRDDKDFDALNKMLPQSFLQTREVNTNYRVLRNVIMQRKGHKLSEWEYFTNCMFDQLKNPELLGVDKERK